MCNFEKDSLDEDTREVLTVTIAKSNDRELKLRHAVYSHPGVELERTGIGVVRVLCVGINAMMW